MLERDPQNQAVTDARVVQHLVLLGARAPSKAEEQAIAALARGQASPGQQKMGLKYALELGGAGALAFDPANERLSAFRAGSQALAQVIANIAGAAWLSFRETSVGAETDVTEQEGRSRGS